MKNVIKLLDDDVPGRTAYNERNTALNGTLDLCFVLGNSELLLYSLRSCAGGGSKKVSYL